MSTNSEQASEAANLPDFVVGATYKNLDAFEKAYQLYKDRHKGTPRSPRTSHPASKMVQGPIKSAFGMASSKLTVQSTFVENMCIDSQDDIQICV